MKRILIPCIAAVALLSGCGEKSEEYQAGYKEGREIATKWLRPTKAMTKGEASEWMAYRLGDLEELEQNTDDLEELFGSDNAKVKRYRGMSAGARDVLDDNGY